MKVVKRHVVHTTYDIFVFTIKVSVLLSASERLNINVLSKLFIQSKFDIIKFAFYFTVKLVGGVTFLPDTIGTMVTFIITEIRRNESLYTMKT
jgi:hypothetical protein